MKRFLSLAIILCILAASAVPALAESPMDEYLADLTLTVKETLDVDDDYTDFYSSYNDGPWPSWYLSWSDGRRELSVNCKADGTIAHVYRYFLSDGGDMFYGYDAAFPAVGEDEARTQAESWLTRLTAADESGRIDSASVTLEADGVRRFAGKILKNGLETPITFTLAIDENGLQSYSRSDSYAGYLGDTPSANASTGSLDAAGLLADSVRLELYYVPDGDGGATLRYVPVPANMVVDAVTGELVDMDALYASFGSGYGYGMNGAPVAEAAAMEMDAGAAAGRSLTEVELASIANYADAMPQQALDDSLRAVPSLGLADFELNRCSYTMDADGVITASLRYACEMTPDRLFGFSRATYDDYAAWSSKLIVYKYITVDAKTGALQSVSTSYPLWGETADAAVAESFLTACAPEMLHESAVCTLSGYNGDDGGVTYARVHDGYFYPANTLYVATNPATGAVDTYHYTWDEDVVFGPSAKPVDTAAALAAYTGALDVTLGYVAWPEAIDYDDPVLYTGAIRSSRACVLRITTVMRTTSPAWTP